MCKHGGMLRGIRGSRFKGIDQNLISVYDMAKMEYRSVFELDENGQDLSYALHVKTGDRLEFVRRGRGWDLEVAVLPYARAKPLIEEAKRLAPLSEGAAASSSGAAASSSSEAPARARASGMSAAAAVAAKNSRF